MEEPLVEAIIGSRDHRISDIFYHFEALTTLANGRTVGRKIGVVQEIILRKYLEQSEDLRRRMYLEQLLEGRSGASHKVEFSWYAVHNAAVRPGKEIPEAVGLRISRLLPLTDQLRVSLPNGEASYLLSLDKATPRSGPLREFLDSHKIDLRIRAVDEKFALLDVVDRSAPIASLESKRVGAQRFSGSDKLGSGIQTIEKAKQASLVAVDLDLLHNGSVKPLEDAGFRKRLISLVALGNGVHWTPKDHAVLGTYVDYTFLVKDAAIIRYADYLRDAAGDEVDFMEFFMEYFKGMTKQEPDDFEVYDSDFVIITPDSEQRSLLNVIEQHVLTVDDRPDQSAL